MVRAGWISFVRLHGVSSTVGSSVAIPISLPGNVDFICDDFRVLVQENLDMPVNFPTANWLAVEGGENPKPRQMTAIREEDPRGIWLEIKISRDYEVATTVANQFIASRGADTHDIDSLLGATIDKDMSDVGVLVSAVAIIPFERSQPHLRNVGHVYWWSTEKYVRLISQNVRLTVVPALTFDRGQLVAIPIRTAPHLVRIGGESRARRALVLASHWLLIVFDLPVQSNERFVVYFQILEALTSCADESPDPQLAQDFALLEQHCRSQATDNSRETIRRLLQRMKERTLKPSLSERFSRLVGQFNPQGADADIAAFRAMAKLRNDLVHAKITQVPSTFRGYDVEDSLRKLAFSYFKHLTDALSAPYPFLAT
jgi:hypothetical protein